MSTNATMIETSEYQILFSYSTPVAAVDKTNGHVLVTAKKHSNTTTRHINKYLAKLPNSDVRYVNQNELDTLFGKMSVTRL